MSSILKALKKVEQKKTGSRGVDPKNRELLNDRPQKRSFLKSTMPFILISVICTAVTYFFLARFFKPAPHPVATPPVAAPPVAAAVPFKSVTSASPYKNVSTAKPPASKVVQHVATSQKPAVKPKNAHAQPSDFIKRKSPVENFSKSNTMKTAQPKFATSLTVNGLALSDGEKRQAVVNGVTVSKGSYVGGANLGWKKFFRTGFDSAEEKQHLRLQSGIQAPDIAL